MGPSTQMEVLTLEISMDSPPSLKTEGNEKKGREWLGMPVEVVWYVHSGSLEGFFFKCFHFLREIGNKVRS